MRPTNPMRSAAQNSMSYTHPFRSSYGPKYQFEPNFRGLNKTALLRLGTKTAMYGGAIGLGALFFVSGIPRIRIDIFERVPFVGHFFVKEPVDPADNPF